MDTKKRTKLASEKSIASTSKPNLLSLVKTELLSTKDSADLPFLQFKLRYESVVKESFEPLPSDG